LTTFDHSGDPKAWGKGEGGEEEGAGGSIFSPQGAAAEAAAGAGAEAADADFNVDLPTGDPVTDDPGAACESADGHRRIRILPHLSSSLTHQHLGGKVGREVEPSYSSRMRAGRTSTASTSATR
jgi:hypothetical protein